MKLDVIYNPYVKLKQLLKKEEDDEWLLAFSTYRIIYFQSSI